MRFERTVTEDILHSPRGIEGWGITELWLSGNLQMLITEWTSSGSDALRNGGVTFVTTPSAYSDSDWGIRMAKKKTDIVGKWFLALNQEGRLDLQGRVLERMKKGIYLIETYGWGDGEVYDERIISVDKMCNWRFYPDFETFGLRAQQHLKSEDGAS